MKPEIVTVVRRWWAGDGGRGGRLMDVAAVPAETLFRGVVAARALAYRAGLLPVRRAAIPVISIGNLTVGGTGKTPLVRWTIERLKEAGLHPAVVARGYGRDELLLHRRWNPDVPVIADPDRVRGARAASDDGADAVVLDDGFQHRRLARALDIVLLSAEQGFPGHLLPRGPYREPGTALSRAGVIVVTHRTESGAAVERTEAEARRLAPGVPVARVLLAPSGWEDLDGAQAPGPTGAVLAVAAIGEPNGFAALVARETGAEVELLSFPDHHEYVPADLERIRATARGRIVAVTEKDAVKLRELPALSASVRVLTLKADVEAGETPLREAILRAVGALESPRESEALSQKRGEASG